MQSRETGPRYTVGAQTRRAGFPPPTSWSAIVTRKPDSLTWACGIVPGMVEETFASTHTVRAKNSKLDPPEIVAVRTSVAAVQLLAARLYLAATTWRSTDARRETH